MGSSIPKRNEPVSQSIPSDEEIRNMSDEALASTKKQSMTDAGSNPPEVEKPTTSQPPAEPAGIKVSLPVKVKAGTQEVYKGGWTKNKPNGVFVSQNGVLMQKSGKTYVRVKQDGKDIPCKAGDTITVNADGTIKITKGGK